METRSNEDETKNIAGDNKNRKMTYSLTCRHQAQSYLLNLNPTCCQNRYMVVFI
jgi:hypothetical protein